LRTGDLGRRRPDGLFEITGRRSRLVKPFGVRVDLDGLEHLLAEHGVRAACTGTDDQLVVAAERATGDEQTVRAVLARRTPWTPDTVAVAVLDDLPRRPNGKLDHPAVARLAHPEPAESTEPVAARRALPWRRRPTRTVREVFARTFPHQEFDDTASFVDLGGDSLTYVQVGADIERALGHLPESWDQVPLGQLAAMTPRRSSLATVETVVVLRALAIVLVVGEHTHLWSLLGGAHLLLAISGWAFARFTLAPHDVVGRPTSALPRRILRSAAMIAIPSSLWIAFRASTQADVYLRDALLAGGLFHPLVQGYWFVDALVQILVGAALLFAVPAVRRLDRRYPFGLPAALLGLALVARWIPGSTTITPDLYSTHLVLWLFVLGWTAHRARTTDQLVATACAALVLIPLFFGSELERAALVAGGLLALLLVPRVRLPRRLATPLTTVASASLGIYLTHFALLPLLAHGVPSIVEVPLDLVVGVVAWRVAGAAVRNAADALRRRAAPPSTDRASPSPAGSGHHVTHRVAA
jgi:hypothetical protein